MHNSLSSSVLILDAVTFHFILDSRMSVDPQHHIFPLSCVSSTPLNVRMQVFGMHYRGIVDSRDSEWYDAVLKECLSLDVSDFLHDVSPYVTNRPLPPYRVAAIATGQDAPSTSAPPVRFIKSEIFESDHETRRPQYPDINGDEQYLGTSLRHGGGGFNQFGSMERAVSGSDFLSNLGPSTLDGTEPVSSSQGYSHNNVEMLVHPDPHMSLVALGFRGSDRELRAHCVRQVVNCIR
jgi:hypothetical protein